MTIVGGSESIHHFCFRSWIDRNPTTRIFQPLACRNPTANPVLSIVGRYKSKDLFLTIVGRSDSHDPVLRIVRRLESNYPMIVTIVDWSKSNDPFLRIVRRVESNNPMIVTIVDRSKSNDLKFMMVGAIGIQRTVNLVLTTVGLLESDYLILMIVGRLKSNNHPFLWTVDDQNPQSSNFHDRWPIGIQRSNFFDRCPIVTLTIAFLWTSADRISTISFFSIVGQLDSNNDRPLSEFSIVGRSESSDSVLAIAGLSELNDSIIAILGRSEFEDYFLWRSFSDRNPTIQFLRSFGRSESKQPLFTLVGQSESNYISSICSIDACHKGVAPLFFFLRFPNLRA